jgi:hypothetical protein
LWTGDRLVTDNDGSHLIRTRTGCIALHAGLHPIRVDYFQAKRAMGLEVLVQGPGLPRQTMPRSLLWRTTRSAPTGLSGRPR